MSYIYKGIRKNKFIILDTDDNTKEGISFNDIVNLINDGVEIEGISVNSDGDIIDSDNCLLSVQVKESKPKNSNLTKAKKAKNDEFYTQLSDIEKELSHYPVEAFKDKIVYLPMDVAVTDGEILQSQFVRYFQQNAHILQFKKLIATCLIDKTNGRGVNKYILTRRTVSYCTPENQANSVSPIEEFVGDDGKLYYRYVDGHTMPIETNVVNEALTDENGTHIVNYDTNYAPQLYTFQDNLDAEESCNPDDGYEYGVEKEGVYGSGDFRSAECLRYFDECDIVVTNPPFSLFRQFIGVLMEKKKKFIVLGNKNAVNYLCAYIRDNKLWIGESIHSGERYFIQPDTDELSKGIGVRWFTNIELGYRREKMILLTMRENESRGVVYQKYDNYGAIEVSKTSSIPIDYDGVIGVPVTFLDKYNPEQFEIVGTAIAGYAFSFTNEVYGSGAAYLNGKKLYSRILVKLRRN